MILLGCVAATALDPPGSIDRQISALARHRAVFQAMKPAEPMYGGEAGAACFYPAGRADFRYIYGLSKDMSLILTQETLVGGKPKQRWRLKLLERAAEGEPKPGELNLYFRKRRLAPKGPISKEIAEALSSPSPFAVYDTSGPTEVLFSYFLIGGEMSGRQPSDMEGAVNRAKLRSSYPISTLETAWLRTHFSLSPHGIAP